MSYPKSMPDDFRRDYYDLRSMLEWGQYYADDNSEEACHIEIGAKRAKEIEARLERLPKNTIIIQTERGRYMITVGDDLTITGLDAGKVFILQPRMSNQLVISQRFD